MKRFQKRMLLTAALAVGSVVGMLRGNEAKEKWVFKIRSRHEEKRQLAEQKKLLRNGGVALDEIEIASFHNN